MNTAQALANTAISFIIAGGGAWIARGLWEQQKQSDPAPIKSNRADPRMKL
jgi:hypothetical protein